ncbi:hypothetical protein P8452_36526 [Trifolium repens]|nr:hypothetical protein P8452_36526 [Trifolium repens]
MFKQEFTNSTLLFVLLSGYYFDRMGVDELELRLKGGDVDHLRSFECFLGPIFKELLKFEASLGAWIYQNNGSIYKGHCFNPKITVVGGPISCKLELALGKLHITMLFLQTHGLKKLPRLYIRTYIFC